MKKFVLNAMVLCALLPGSGQFTANAQADGQVSYGFSIGKDYGLVSFSLDQFKTTPVWQQENRVSAGTFAEGYYYAAQVNSEDSPSGIFAYDLKTGEATKVIDMTDAPSLITDMTYDYTTGTLYAIADDYPETAFLKINLAEKRLEYLANFDNQYGTIAADPYGKLFLMSHNGTIYTISKEDYSLTLVYTGSDYLKGLQSMDYDFNSEKFYWIHTDYGNCSLIEIDPETWQQKQIGTVGGAQITGLFTGYTKALPTSPAAPSNLKATPDANGEKECTLSWTNPTTTFERNPLSEITSITIYRNGEVVTTLSNAKPGETMTYTDTPAEADYYTYRVTASNESGEGMFNFVKTYVGIDLPVAPTNVVATATGVSTIQITWDAPTEGIHGKWLDTENMSYKVVRKNDNKVLVENLKETTYTDNVDGLYTGYRYIITPVVPTGEGLSAESNSAQAGQPLSLPLKSTFMSANQIDSLGWRIIDQDGNGKKWVSANTIKKESHPLGLETYFDKTTDASDWLISAPVKLSAGQESEISFEVYTAYYPTEKLEIWFGQSSNPEELQLFKQIDAKGAYYTPVSVVETLPIVEEEGNYYVAIRYASPKTTYSGYGVHLNNFVWHAVNEGIVKGKVTCDGQPLEGITVNVGDFSGVTSATGEYVIENVTAGSYTASVNAVGYRPAQQEIEVAIREESVCDFELTKLPTYTLSGNITDSKGNPITGAKVILSGYAPFEAVSDNAAYTLENVYEGTYQLTILKNNFVNISQEVTLGENTQLDFTMKYDNIAPFYVNANYNTTDGTTIDWLCPATIREMSYDNGTPADLMGYPAPDEFTVLGSIYRQPGVVREVKWMTMPVMDGVDKIHIYVFDLDENGKPTDKMLYSAKNVPTVHNEWNTYRIPVDVVAENGFFVALSADGMFGIAYDNGKNNKWEENQYTQCFNINYTATYDYRYMDETSNPSRCFLLRAVCENIEPEDATQPDVEYNVWRVKADQASMDDESTWTQVAGPQKELVAVDNKAASGQYVYAVKAFYPVDNLTSEASFSSVVDVNMKTTVIVNVTANSAKEHANGALVSLASADNEYTGTVVDNKAIFNDVRKDVYVVTIQLNGFENIRERNVKFEGEEREFTLNYTLTQKFDIAQNIDILATENPETWDLVWNVQPNIFDDFEGNEYQDFTINPTGKFGWQYIDNDGIPTWGFGATTFPNMRATMAAILFNSRTTTPPLGINTAYSGVRNLGFFAAMETTSEAGVVINESDDYFISPLLKPYKDFKFSFWARTYTEETGYRERIRVGYSTTTPEIDSFKWFEEESFYVPLEYTKYEYDIPADAKYVVLNSQSFNNFLLLVDDVFIGVDGQKTGCEYAPVNVEKYEVYLDGKMVAETTDNKYTFENVPAGNHTAAIVQVFATGKSEKLEIEFGDGGGSVNAIQTEGIDAYVANGILYIEGNYQHAELFNVAGVKVMEASGNRTTDVTSLVDGVYVLKVTTANGIASKKLVIE